MGVCEGTPRAVLPDYSGRADYTGANVNQAARFMDAAAHGGMVACEATLVDSILGRWNAMMMAAAGATELGASEPLPSQPANSRPQVRSVQAELARCLVQRGACHSGAAAHALTTLCSSSIPSSAGLREHFHAAGGRHQALLPAGKGLT